MDVTPEAVREGKFREALRGYNRDDVDEFLEQLATGIAVLQERLRDATQRATDAEGKASETAELDESLKRTLVLAQRTADLAIEEARREAERLVGEANAAREALLADVETERSRLFAELHDGVREEVDNLHAAREQLQQDVDNLSAYVKRQRERLRETLREALGALDDGLPDLDPSPEVHEVEVAPAPTATTEVDEAEADEPEHAATDIDLAAEEQRNAEVSNGERTFMSELHRAVVEEGARSENGESGLLHDDVLPPPDEKARAFFDTDDESDARRFGSLRRRRR